MKAIQPRVSDAALKVLARMRHRAMTVEELGLLLKLTPNAVRDQLRKLESSGLVVRSGVRPGASKPSILYSITLEGEILFSRLYLPVLTEFLRTAEGACSGKQLTAFMSDTGKSLARRFPPATGDLGTRARKAADLMKDLGGLMEVERDRAGLVFRSSACPLAALTSENRAACKVLEGFLAEYLDASVSTCCQTGHDPKCCFEVRQ